MIPPPSITSLLTESAVLTINYSVSDGTTTTANTATITITGANDAPTVSAITSTKSEDDSSYVIINLLSDANAADPDSSDSPLGHRQQRLWR